jgi:hypothetical protein
MVYFCVTLILALLTSYLYYFVFLVRRLHKCPLKAKLETLRQNASSSKMVTKKEMPSRTACHTAYQDYDLVASNAQSIIDSIDAGMPSLWIVSSCKRMLIRLRQEQAARGLYSAAVAPSYRRLPQEIQF